MTPASGGSAASAELIVEDRGPVRWIVFNRPAARNAMTWNMYELLLRTCEQTNLERAVRAMVLTGAGRAFAAGTDIAQFKAFSTAQDGIEYEARCESVLRALEAVHVPTVAAIAGPCAGAGAVIASACDLRIGSASATFGVPIARTLGNCLTVANCARLAAVVGIPRLKDLLLRARLMQAREMLACGLLAELVDDEESLGPRAQAIAEDMASLAPLTLWAAKEAVRRARDQLVAAEGDADLVSACYASSDFQEGVEAFLAKRKPAFRGE